MFVYSYTDSGGERVTVETTTGDSPGILLMIDPPGDGDVGCGESEQRSVFMPAHVAAAFAATVATAAHYEAMLRGGRLS
jgi:hypothetical protein